MNTLGGRIAGAVAALCTAGTPLAAGAATSPFAGWAAVVVAGDFHAHSGAPSEAFDNARRDVGQALVKAGFDPRHIQEFSVRPQNYPNETLLPSSRPRKAKAEEPGEPRGEGPEDGGGDGPKVVSLDQFRKK